MFRNLPEVELNLLTSQSIKNRLNNGSLVLLKGKEKNVLVGNTALIKVNTSIGVSKISEINNELEKLILLSNLENPPDTLMDLSVQKLPNPLYKHMINEFGGPVGTVPHYFCFSQEKGFEKNRLLDEIELEAQEGVGFMTLHLTPNKDLITKAIRNRLIPFTSRGGGIIIKDILLNNRKENIFIENLDEISNLFIKYNIVLSLGSSFRPASIIDGFDPLHIEEMNIQNELISFFKKKGIQVLRECIGHATLSHIKNYAVFLRKGPKVPIMPLGPIATDIAENYDNIAAVIGATQMAMDNCAHLLNSITRDEHKPGIPTKDSIIEGLRCAQIVAHCINIAKFNTVQKDQETYELRAKYHSCNILKKDSLAIDIDNLSEFCSRCGSICPLRILTK